LEGESKSELYCLSKGRFEKMQICEGNGIIYIWRSDLEDFDEIRCPECKEKE